MSSEAIAWAFKQEVKSSSVKFTLVALCECANYKTGRITPSIAHITEITGQNRKTIISNIAELERVGLIVDTGERCGRTGQIKVYSPVFGTVGMAPKQEAHYVYRLTNPNTGEFYIGVRSFLGDPVDDSYRGSGNWPSGALYRGIDLHREIVGIFATRSEAERVEANMIGEAIGLPLCRNVKEESHKRDTNPKTGQLNSPKNGRKQSQKRDTEPSWEPSETNSKARGDHPLPDGWLPAQFGQASKARAIVDGWPPGEAEFQFERFAAHHRKLGNRFKDWQAAWATWVLGSIKFQGASNDRGSNQVRGRSSQGRSSLAVAIDEGLEWLDGGP